jgi:hypothetical protein
MTTTLARINTLLMALHMPPVRNLQLQPNHMSADSNPTPMQFRSMTPAHDVLDTIDRHVGIITRNRYNTTDRAPVGERVRRLERHIKAQAAPPYFWLGIAAEPNAEPAPA